PAILLGEGGCGFGLLELLADVVRHEDLHAEESATAGSVDARRAARIDQGGIDRDAWPEHERAAQFETAAVFRRFANEEPLFGADTENDAGRHVQPPETAGMMVRMSPDASAVSRPAPSRMLSVFTNKLTWRRRAPVSSQTLRWSGG